MSVEELVKAITQKMVQSNVAKAKPREIGWIHYAIALDGLGTFAISLRFVVSFQVDNSEKTHECLLLGLAC